MSQELELEMMQCRNTEFIKIMVTHFHQNQDLNLLMIGLSQILLHFRLGNPDLKPEESDNSTLGVVLTPTDALTITVDTWSIEKENTLVFLEELIRVF